MATDERETRDTTQAKVEDIIRHEADVLGLREGDSELTQPSALCLSGGGIRSATFCLGVIQGLAQRSMLGAFHYLSTVSGGGYIGAWLAAWISRTSLPEVERELREASLRASTRAGDAEPEPVRRLRAFSNFLSPVRGLSGDSFSLAAIYLRNLLLHWLCIVPVLLAGLLLPRLLLSASIAVEGGAALAGTVLLVTATALLALANYYAESAGIVVAPPAPAAGVAAPIWKRSAAVAFIAPHALAALLIVLSFSIDPAPPSVGRMALAALTCAAGALVGTVVRRLRGDDAPFLAEAMSVASAGATAFAAIWVCNNVLSMLADQRDTTQQRLATFGLPCIFALLWAAYVLRAGLNRRYRDEQVREWWGRASGLLMAFGMGWLLLSLLVIQVPEWLLGIQTFWIPSSAGTSAIVSMVIAVATAVAGFWSKHGPALTSKADGILNSLGIKSLEIAALLSMLGLSVVANIVIGYALTSRLDFDASLVGSTGTAATNAPDPKLAKVQGNIPEANKQAGELEQKYAKAIAEKVDSQEPKSKDKDAQNTAKKAETQTGKPAAKDASDKAEKTGSAGKCTATEEDAPGAKQVTCEVAPASELPLAAKWRLLHLMSLHYATPLTLLLGLIALLAIAIVASYFVGANAFSMNALYGNRLTRAYLGASATNRNPDPFVGFDPSDNLCLHKLAPQQGTRSLYPVFNAALNLIRASGERLEWQQRKAASYTMTPHYCGSDHLDYVPTKNYSNADDGVTVGLAIAVSGAAASPSMGYHSSTLVSMVMALLNLRLGWWLPNPRVPAVHRKSEPRFALAPMLSELLSTTGDHRSFVNVSDGGHFENLGLYEMVRRRCRRIVVVDAGHDPNYEYEDLENAIRKIRVDFGIRISIVGNRLLLPDVAKASERHCLYATVHYDEIDPSLQPGTILLIKPILCGNEPMDVTRYAATSRTNDHVFPQQPTSDQFFDEAQFESYRALGLHSLLESLPSGGVWPQPTPLPPPPAPPGVNVVPAAHTRGQAGDSKPESWFASLTSGGQAALLASAVAATSALTITGTLSLANPEVRLDPASAQVHLSEDTIVKVSTETPLKFDVAGSLEGIATAVNAGDQQVLTAWNTALGLLGQSLEQRTLSVTLKNPHDVPAATLPKETVDALNAAAKATSTAADQLRLASESGAGATKELRDAATTLDAIVKQQLANLRQIARDLAPYWGAGSPAMTSLEAIQTYTKNSSETIEKVRAEAEKIRKGVAEMSPRRNVRGAGE